MRPAIDHSKDLRRKLAEGKSFDDALVALRTAGASIIDCIVSVRTFRKCDIVEAKRIVESSSAWADSHNIMDEILLALSESPDKSMQTTNSRCFDSFATENWNACLEILGRPIDTLDSIQRPAARVFEYYGRVMNGGHSLHFDVHGDSRDEELLGALKELGGIGHARILAQAFFLRNEAKHEKDEEDYVDETIEDLDRQFGQLKPEIPELLARYFKAHPKCLSEKSI